MAGIAVGLLWISYASGLYGYCLIRGYKVTPKQLMAPNWPPCGEQKPVSQDTNSLSPGIVYL